MRFARIVPALRAAGGSRYSRPGGRAPLRLQTRSILRWPALVAASTFHINWLEAKTGYLRFLGRAVSLPSRKFFIFFPLYAWRCESRSSLRISIVLPSDRAICARPHTQQLWSETLSFEHGWHRLGCLRPCGRADQARDRTNLALRISGVVLCIFIVAFG